MSGFSQAVTAGDVALENVALENVAQQLLQDSGVALAQEGGKAAVIQVCAERLRAGTLPGVGEVFGKAEGKNLVRELPSGQLRAQLPAEK